MASVLIIEDESKVARFVQKGLIAEGIDTTIAGSGDEGLRLARGKEYDVLIVDLSLPGIDGLTLIRTLRQHQTSSFILILSARGKLEDKLVGFGVGADDYLPKPFAFEELLARIYALVRRREAAAKSYVLSYADLQMDLTAHRVTREGKPIDLTQREFNLLEFFLRNPEQILTRTRIGEAVWNEQFDRESNVIEVYMMYLRKKIDDGREIPLIQTIRGIGYRMATEN